MNPSASAPHTTSQDRETRRQLILDALRAEAESTLQRLADELVDLPDNKIFGPIEYTLRDISHEFISRALPSRHRRRQKRVHRLQLPLPLLPRRSPASSTTDASPSVDHAPEQVTVQRAYYYCKSCDRGHCPFDQANDLLGDHLSSGLRPLACLAGTLGSFRDAADDILRRFCGVSVSASVVRRVTEKAGTRLLEQQRAGDIVVPPQALAWDFTIKGHSHTAAFIGLDAFSVPIQKSGGKKADYRMLYTATLYTPDKEHTHYLGGF